MTTAELKPLNCKQPFSSLNYRASLTMHTRPKCDKKIQTLLVAFERITCQSSPEMIHLFEAPQFFHADRPPSSAANEDPFAPSLSLGSKEYNHQRGCAPRPTPAKARTTPTSCAGCQWKFRPLCQKQEEGGGCWVNLFACTCVNAAVDEKRSLSLSLVL
jgi:hypothetical protein